MNTMDLDHYYRFGDIYEAAEAIQRLEATLRAVCRQKVVDLSACREIKRQIAEIREIIASFLPDAG